MGKFTVTHEISCDAETFWKVFFEKTNRVESILRTDPAEVYGRMDFETCDAYRKVIEALAWATGTAQTRNPRFLRELEKCVPHKDAVVLLLCRSGKRSIDAGQVLEKAGFSDVYNVLHGFEGDLDENFHRGRKNGWRFDGLPWAQM